MVKITGMKSHKARLKRIRGAAMVREVGKAVETAADELEGEAEHSIVAGSSSGKVKGSKHLHVRSLPGQPPNEEDGDLRRGIEKKRTGRLSFEVSANAPHSVPLEFGTSKMAARPFMQPAAQKTRPKAQALVIEAVKRVARGEKL